MANELCLAVAQYARNIYLVRWTSPRIGCAVGHLTMAATGAQLTASTTTRWPIGVGRTVVT